MRRQPPLAVPRYRLPPSRASTSTPAMACSHGHVHDLPAAEPNDKQSSERSDNACVRNQEPPCVHTLPSCPLQMAAWPREGRAQLGGPMDASPASVRPLLRRPWTPPWVVLVEPPSYHRLQLRFGERSLSCRQMRRSVR